MRENIFIIIAQEGFRDEELFKPLEVIRPSAYEPIIISPKGGICKGMLGSTVQADLSLKQAEINENTK
ncbi:MAG: DJ-1/PfpI family protein, partial [Nanoarchaeota archaeon]